MRYLRSIGFVTTNPQWGLTLLALAVASLIPWIGPVIANGYQSALVVELHGRRNDEGWTGFQFDRFSDYLFRGIRLFLVGLAVAVVMIPVAFVFIGGMALMLGLSSAAMPQQEPPALLLVAIVGLVLLFVAVMVALSALAAPLWLRAAFNEDIAKIFDMGFFRDFWSRNLMTAVVAHFFMAAAAIVLVLLGMLACVVGIFPAIGLVFLIQSHIYWQLYELHLASGGRRADA